MTEQESDTSAASDGAASDNEVEAATPGRRRMVVMSLLLVVLLAVSVVGALVLDRAWQAREANSDREQAVAVTRQVVLDLITINDQNSQQNVDRMLEVATDPFRAELGKFSKVFGQILTQGRVQANGGIDAAAIERIDEISATVLVSASTTVKNTEIPNGAPRNFNLVVGLRQEGDTWRVASVDVAP